MDAAAEVVRVSECSTWNVLAVEGLVFSLAWGAQCEDVFHVEHLCG